MQLSLSSDQLHIDLEWYEQLWAFTFTQRWVIPLDHIIQSSTEEPQSHWSDIRAPGTYLPGVIKAGTYHTKQGREFWYVTADRHYLTLELQNEPYSRIILTTERNEFWAEQINQQKLGTEI